MRNDKPLHVVHVIEGFAGGTATYMRVVLPELVNRGFSVSLICSRNRANPVAEKQLKQLENAGVYVNILDMCREINPIKDLAAFIRLFNKLRKLRPDIIHTHCSKAGALGRISAALLRIPVRLHSPHCFAFLRGQNYFNERIIIGIERQLGKLTTQMVAVGDAEATVAVRMGIVPRTRCVTIKNGIPDNSSTRLNDSQEQKLLLRKSMNITQGGYIVASIGRLVDYKGVLCFLDAARQSQTSNTQFLLAGDGKLRSIAEQYITCHGLAHKAKLLGFIEYIDQIYAIADLIVLCSEAEACPYVILEAMQSKRPIIATSVIGIREHIKHNHTGILVAPSCENLAKTIDGMLSDINKRETISANAHHFFEANYKLETQLNRMCQLYQTGAYT